MTGLVSDNWLEKLSADLTARMADYAEDQIQFVILGLVQDPVITIKKELAENIKSLLLVQTQLSTFAETLSTTSTTEDTSKENTDDSPFPALGDGTLLGTSPEYGVRGHDIDIATIDENIKTYIMEQDANSLFVYRDGLVQKQRMLRLSLRNELLSWQLDAEKASNRRHDYGPAVKKWLSSLYRVGFLREIMDNSHAKGLVV
jgi:ubiquitin carboxyl-terminal hydrolase L5